MSNDHYPGSSDPKLDARLCVLEKIFVQLAQAGAGTTDSILGGGFGSVSDQLETVSRHLKTISDQMAPLAELTQEPVLGDDQKKRLAYLIRGWRPPKWNGLSSLSFDGLAVDYIGKVAPDGCERNDNRYNGSSAS